MRTLAAVALVAILIAAGCGSTGSTNPSPSASSSGPGSRLKPSDIKPATDPVTVSWVALKDAVGRRGSPRDPTTQMHLVNKAHPDSRKPIPLSSNKKVLSNAQMGALLALLDERGFDRLGTAGLEPSSIPAGSSNGAIVVRRGGRVKSLVFKKGMDPRSTTVPEAYRNCRDVIIMAFNEADQYQVYTSEDRVLGIERLK